MNDALLIGGDGSELRAGNVIGTMVHATTPEQALETVGRWAVSKESRAVFFCNVHSVTHGAMDKDFSRVLEAADLRLPDGAPVALLLRAIGLSGQTRVCGPDLMQAYYAHAERNREAIFLYGSTEPVLAKLRERLSSDYPGLVVHSLSPPFRQLTPEEDEEIIRRINDSGARTVWVALGCPKQEKWIADHKGRVHAVMLGVGAAFAFHAGTTKRAPELMRRMGLEWLHRLLVDPRRLWARYLTTNTIFLVFGAKQLGIRWFKGGLRRGG